MLKLTEQYLETVAYDVPNKAQHVVYPKQIWKSRNQAANIDCVNSVWLGYRMMDIVGKWHIFQCT